jgi:hypothetical protein
MKLPSLKDLDYKKILAIAVLVITLTAAALVLSAKFSKIKILGIELEGKTEQSVEAKSEASNKNSRETSSGASNNRRQNFRRRGGRPNRPPSFDPRN